MTTKPLSPQLVLGFLFWNMKIYIAGSITARKIEVARNHFQKGESVVIGWGETPINPMKLPHNHDKTWQSYMIECISELVKCDAIFMLKGWNKSKGARLELRIAKSLKLKIIWEQ